MLMKLLAASAASYLKRQANGNYSKAEKDLNKGHGECFTSDEASFVATKNSLTSVVARKEEMKEAVVKDLNSAKSLPSEWFICDDESITTRYFAIQGSESLASWQTNLLFEPVQFEGLDVLVHRGIYKASKGMYRQMLQEVRAHTKAYGKSAALRFTGHSLGGSLALLINLMLLILGEAPTSSLLPVITFGAPKSHVQAITMHRDIVPRAFSCNYPDHIVQVLKAINGNFRNLPCLLKQARALWMTGRLLLTSDSNFMQASCSLQSEQRTAFWSSSFCSVSLQSYVSCLVFGSRESESSFFLFPCYILNNRSFCMLLWGKLLIMQPDEKFSPHHHLLPPESGIFLLSNSSSDSDDATKLLQEMQSAFLNSPHPLEILSDRSAYGSEGTVYRDHDVNSYLRSVRYVIRQELKVIRKSQREERRRQEWWPHNLSKPV